MKIHLACAALSGMLLLSGCAADPDGSLPSPQSERASPSSSVATPTASPVGVEASLSTKGYGYVLIGQPVPADHEGAEVISWNPDACDVGAGAWEGVAGAGLFIDTAEFGNAAAPIVSIVVLSDSGPTTSSGIGVGSSEQQFLTAYPSADETFDLGYNGVQYNVAGDAGRLQFVIADGSVARFGVVATSLPSEQTKLGATDWYGPCS